MEKVRFKPFSIEVQGRLVDFERPAVMGILNVTPDSFYDGGRHNGPEALVDHARKLIAEGADMVDIGVVSSRPGAQLLPPDVEAERLAEAVRLVRQALPDARQEPTSSTTSAAASSTTGCSKPLPPCKFPTS